MTDNSDVSPLLATDRWAGSLVPPAAKPPSMRTFGVVMLVGFGILGGLLLWGWWKTGSPVRLVLGSALATAGVVIFLWSLVAPSSLPPVYHGWMRFGMALGTVISTVLLGVLYFVVVTPVGWLMRVTGTDPLERKLVRGGGSYWRAHAPPAAPDDYHHMS